MRDQWRLNEHRDYRKMPEGARQFTKVDVILDDGRIWYEQSPVLAFIGHCIIEQWRPSASNFQLQMEGI